MSANGGTNRKAAVDANYEAFLKALPELLESDRGRFALLKDNEIVEVFDTATDALTTGRLTFGKEFFSVQEVTDRVADLGYFSHAVRNDPI